jgi:hypothetical protein
MEVKGYTETRATHSMRRLGFRVYASNTFDETFKLLAEKGTHVCDAIRSKSVRNRPSCVCARARACV